MSNETKRDVFLQIAKENRDLRMYDPESIEPKELIEQDYQDWIREYASALPDDLPVIPEAVGNQIVEDQGEHLSDELHLADREALGDCKMSKWIADNDETFARAWVLGVWRVKETGEIVKLDAEE